MTDGMMERTLDGDVSVIESIAVRISWLSRRRMEQELDAFQITMPQYMALRCMQQHQHGCSMSQLAGSAHQVSATMTGIVDRLVDSGLAQRERDPNDRRSQRVVLTPAGTDLLERISRSNQQWIRHFLSTLDPEERHAMIQLGERYLVLLEINLQPEQG